MKIHGIYKKSVSKHAFNLLMRIKRLTMKFILKVINLLILLSFYMFVR
ncbi:unnamed protein product [Schistosoma mattheei]|uniref:Uncharacterized protein n=1 Tax=Schistosoma mattheei TaxID=31246 RepID=A0A183PZW1_9TREM|nr:unnamed protein product [Schistosoma mattheei]